jgi:hypothetical protein
MWVCVCHGREHGTSRCCGAKAGCLPYKARAVRVALQGWQSVECAATPGKDASFCACAIAGVAQLVEQRIRNAKVVGSTPISGTILLLFFPSIISWRSFQHPCAWMAFLVRACPWQGSAILLSVLLEIATRNSTGRPWACQCALVTLTASVVDTAPLWLVPP